MDYFKNSSFRKILPRSRQKSFSSILLRCQLKDPYHSAEEHFYKARQEHLTSGLKNRNTDIEQEKEEIKYSVKSHEAWL